jgi:hypothetical protein
MRKCPTCGDTYWPATMHECDLCRAARASRYPLSELAMRQARKARA